MHARETSDSHYWVEISISESSTVSSSDAAAASRDSEPKRAAPAKQRLARGSVVPTRSLRAARPELPKATPWAELAAGAQVGRYIIDTRLRGAGLATVYRARALGGTRDVALALLRGGPLAGTDAQQRGEASALVALSHPHVIDVYEADEYDGRVVLAMELVAGDSLATWLATADEAERAARGPELLRAFASGLAALHRAGVVHGDIRPENVLVGVDGRLRVYGFAQAAKPAEVARARVQVSPRPTAVESRVTAKAIKLALPGPPRTAPTAVPQLFRPGVRDPAARGYAAPEQALGVAPTAAGDQFGYCAIAYEILCGDAPVDAIDASAETPLHAVMWRGLSPDAGERFASMDALLEEIERTPGAGWRRLAVALVLFGCSLAVVFGAVRLGVVAAERCAASQEAVGAIWNDETARALSAGFVASGHPGASDAAERVTRALDEYAGELAQVCGESCVEQDAVELTPALVDARSQCLERARVHLAALTEVLLERGHAVVVDRALRAVQALPSPHACADAGAAGELAQRADTPAELALQHSLARAAALRDTGRIEHGVREAEDAVARAAELGDRAGEAEALAVLGALQRLGGRASLADETLGRAQRLARDPELRARIGDRLLVAIAHARAHIALQQPHRLDQARAHLRALDALAPRGRDLAQRAERRFLDGSALLQSGAYDAAARALEDAWNLRVRAAGERSLATLDVLAALVDAEFQRGQIDRACAHASEVLAGRASALGGAHVENIDALVAVGSCHERRGRLEQALERYQRALTLSRAAFGDSHPRTARAVATVAQVQVRRGRDDEAHALLELSQAL
ncbi:tetratricopeptide repeat-containing protein kinase family protein [Haliangium ochraceum]|uniref:Serine/threonine protein kinase with TPR repeats n=1 Tax=Haliangium ochraceum (strain DSM 14365 / JCM 11303 / SMP-2) TaxID=502025 RepID=D0LT88_HALO1|nr:tetratricopeptide repeat-containing protein kinase family protein [Haliangium ochraceum]ACY19224.1 serine/threonine protein kinase with TPR repeats [Haliangium ochraceum DSM 14365]